MTADVRVPALSLNLWVRIFAKVLVIAGIAGVAGCSYFPLLDEAFGSGATAKEAESGRTGDSSWSRASGLTVVSGEDAQNRYLKQLVRQTAKPLSQDNVGYYMDVQFATLQQNLSNSDLTLTRGDDQISIVLPGAPTFDTGSDKINEQASSVLSVLGDILTEYDKTLVAVVGHSDAQGTEVYNEALAQRRAIAVGEYLKGKHVARERLVVMSYGSKVPVADNNTPDGRAKNRRVELLLKPIAVPRIGG